MKPRKKQRNKSRMVMQNANRMMNVMMDRTTFMMEKKQNLRKLKNSTLRWNHRSCYRILCFARFWKKCLEHLQMLDDKCACDG